MVERKKEIALSLCLIAAAVAVFVLTLLFPSDLAVEGGIGPRFFPQAVAVLLGLLGLILLVGAVRRSGAKKADGLDVRPAKSVLLVFLIIVGYAVAIDYAGFPLATFVFVAVMISYYLSPFAWRRVLTVPLPVAVATTVVSYAVFGIALKIPLPRGMLF